MDKQYDEQYFEERYTTSINDGAVDPSSYEPVTNQVPLEPPVVQHVPVSANNGSSPALLDSQSSDQFRRRWSDIQGKFVDDPRTAVQQADSLVSEVIDQLTQMFAKEHAHWRASGIRAVMSLRKICVWPCSITVPFSIAW
ncbi:MAG: hypothetical protein P4L50_23720 [Anaerolineaceae bacterium]|nr:hypothetical protein [Anaerolineaceae bacterium]